MLSIVRPDDFFIGLPVPNVELGAIINGAIETLRTAALFASGKFIILGVPGAFTPVCSKEHVPDFVANADRFAQLGFSQLVCIAQNDPFVLEAWAKSVDPAGRIKFISDGNLAFCKALSLTTTNRSLFLGVRSERYLMVVEDGIIQRLRVEPNILVYSCTSASETLLGETAD